MDYPAFCDIVLLATIARDMTFSQRDGVKVFNELPGDDRQLAYRVEGVSLVTEFGQPYLSVATMHEGAQRKFWRIIVTDNQPFVQARGSGR